MSITSRFADFARGVIKGFTKAVQTTGSKVAVGAKMILQHGNPGRWISDHREEANHVTGWNYVCIHALGIQAMQCDVNVFTDDGLDPIAAAGAKRVRKSLRRKIIGQPGLRKEYQEGAGAKPVDPQHPLVQILQKPNPRQSGASFRYECVLQLEATGSLLIYNVPNGLGKTVERYVIPTGFATPVMPRLGLPYGGWKIDGGISRYMCTMDQDGFQDMGPYWSMFTEPIPAENVQVIRWPHAIWRDDGYSKLSAGAVWSDTAEQMDIARVATLKNAVTPSVVVAMKGENLTQDDMDEASYRFNEKNAGAVNNGKAILTTDATITPMGQTGREVDFQNTYPQARMQMQALHTTPSCAIGIDADGSHAAFYIQMKQYITLKVQPELDFLAEEDTRCLAPQFGAGLTIEYTAQSIDDPATQAAEDANEIAAGNTMTVREWRISKGRAPFGDERDEQYVGQKQQPPLDPNIPAAAAAQAANKPKPKEPQTSNGDNDQAAVADEHGTGISTKRIPKNRIRDIFADPVLLAAFNGAGEETSDEEFVELIGA